MKQINRMEKRKRELVSKEDLTPAEIRELELIESRLKVLRR